MKARPGSHEKVVTIGGGTGSHVVLSGLKSYPVEITAIIGMFDDGGSTGVLRRELKVMPPGDVRQCLVALSAPDHAMKELFEYRFYEGSLSGHSVGNIILSALEKNAGSISRAIDITRTLMNITHQVIPVTLQETTLCSLFDDGQRVLGQNAINRSSLVGRPFRLRLVPAVELNADARAAIMGADKIVINPGDLYTSIIPNFLVDGIREALSQAHATVIYVANLMTINGHTDGLSVVDHQKILAEYMHPKGIDCVIYNTAIPDETLFHAYTSQNQHPVILGDQDAAPGIRFIGEDLIDSKVYEKRRGDTLQRSFIRHNADKLARILYEL